MPLEGPVLIAIYSFTTVLAIAAIADVKVVLAGGITGAPRIARHLWRMCLGLTLATGSAFTNGFSRFLPGPHHVPPVFFLPQFVAADPADLLDDPRTVHGLVQARRRRGAGLRQPFYSPCANFTGSSFGVSSWMTSSASR